MFHWHHYDQESFSLESESMPFFKKAAINDGWQYSHAEVRELVQFAWERGIRVIPEFETPGHNNFAAADPRLESKLPHNGPQDPLQMYGAMNPCSNFTRTTLRGLLEEFIHLFPDKRVHLGGDEFGYGSWGGDHSIYPGCPFEGTANLTSETQWNQLEGRWTEMLHSTLRKRGRSAMHWHDPVTMRAVNISKDSIIEAWGNGEENDPFSPLYSKDDLYQGPGNT
eukprot:COSAG06_NODE_1174_length_10412_cov_15.779405_3_plen_224_part_00